MNYDKIVINLLEVLDDFDTCYKVRQYRDHIRKYLSMSEPAFIDYKMVGTYEIEFYAANIKINPAIEYDSKLWHFAHGLLLYMGKYKFAKIEIISMLSNMGSIDYITYDEHLYSTKFCKLIGD